MKEQDKKALIEKMTHEREELLKEVSITQFLTDLVTKKARNVVEKSKQHGGYSVKGSTLLYITCFEKNEDFYRVMIDSEGVKFSEEEFQEMIEAISLIGDSGYDVQKKPANDKSAETFLNGYQINM